MWTGVCWYILLETLHYHLHSYCRVMQLLHFRLWTHFYCSTSLKTHSCWVVSYSYCSTMQTQWLLNCGQFLLLHINQNTAQDLCYSIYTHSTHQDYTSKYTPQMLIFLFHFNLHHSPCCGTPPPFPPSKYNMDTVPCITEICVMFGLGWVYDSSTMYDSFLAKNCEGKPDEH